MSDTLERAVEGKPQTWLPEAIRKDLEKRKKTSEILEVGDMQERLRHYKPSGADVTYETPRIDLRRGSGCECHVFEMFWADLSRLPIMGIRTLVAFYQLLFFVCDLGSRTIQYAWAKDLKGKRRWWVFYGTHHIAHLILVLGIPILNLALFGLAIAAVASGYLSKVEHAETVAALILGGVLAGVGAYFFLHDQSSSFRSWPWKFLVVLVAFLLPLGLIPVVDLERWVPMVTWLLMALGIYWLMTIYERRKGHAKACGVFVLVLTTIAFGWQLHRLGWPSGWQQLFEAGRLTLRAAILYGHWPLWISLAVFTLVCWLVSEAMIRFAGLCGEDQRHARHVAVTARISLAIPAVLVLIVDLGLWQLLVRNLDKLPGDLITNAVQKEVEQVFLLSVPVGTGWGLAVFLLAVLFAVWLILPAVIAEGHPPKDASRLGHTLSAGFGHLKWSGWAFQFLATIALLISGVLLISHVLGAGEFIGKPANEEGLALGALSVAFFLLFTFRRAGEAIRSVLDIALDVVNWLRYDPPDGTPRARICARFVSLLRYICNWRDPESAAPYDAIVILSHSQGTVITADLFRYLKHIAEPGLERIFRPAEESERLPVYLFTMGCPLRQLYSLRFPDQYAWASDTADWDSATQPNPDDLNVALWSNFYRSGDYVGRVLWHPDSDQSNTKAWDADLEWASGRRRERCIGSGAHTHYWDKTAPGIAKQLDYLIDRGCNR